VSDEQVRTPEDEQQGRKVQLRDRGMAPAYAGFFTITGDQDIVILSFGNQFRNPDVIQFDAKVALSMRNAKRMAVTLGNAIREYEKQYGEIDIQPPAQRAQTGQQQDS